MLASGCEAALQTRRVLYLPTLSCLSIILCITLSRYNAKLGSSPRINITKSSLGILRNETCIFQRLYNYFSHQTNKLCFPLAVQSPRPSSSSSAPGTIGPPENFCAMTDTLYKKFGPIVKLDGIFSRASMVFLYEPEHFYQVYRAEDVTPLRPGFATLVYYYNEMRKERFNGVHGLTIAQGPKWRDFRTKVNPALLKLKLVKLYAPALDEIAQEMVARLAKLKDDPDYLQENFNLELTKWSLESIALVGLGARIDCLHDNLSVDHPASQLMQCTKDILDIGFKLELFPTIWKNFPTPAFKKLIRTLDTQWNVSEKYIQEARKRISERDHDIPDEDKSVIEKLLAVDEKVAVMMANEMLMAGIDTVAHVTIAFIYCLAVNPEVQEKLRQHIRSGDQKYLRACLKECLRLYPVVSSNLRRTSKEHVVAGYHIPEGIDVVAPNEYLSRMEKYYPRPTEYLPDRWTADKSDPLFYGNAHPMITLPFGFGIRSCIGRRIAELEIEIFIQRLVDEFKIGWEGPPLKTITKVVNTFKKPFYFKFESAK